MKIKFFDRVRGASKKSAATSDEMTLNQLLSWLGVHDVSGGALSEATYYACLKVLSEAIGKLPLRLMQSTPEHGVRPLLQHRWLLPFPKGKETHWM